MRSPKRSRIIPTLGATATLCLIACTRSSEAPTRTAQPRAATSGSGAQAPMQAYRDPVTGAFGAPPAPSAPRPSQSSSLTGPPAGLVERPTPYGGVVVQLPPEVSSNFVAEITSDGSVRAHCEDPRPAGGR